MLKPVNVTIAILLSLSIQSAQASDKANEQVWQAETAFAQSMADRDFARFTTFVSEYAVFFNGESVSRGKPQVLAQWQGYFNSEAAPFSWQPEQVEVLASGHLAHSSGPVFNAAGQQVATFNSVWQKEADGVWRVVFDKGTPQCPSKER